ncbi:MAG: hypothetical protein Q4C81_02695 [Kocuria sp.]|nr:hypothetical protein [Kocuria sp.]
MGVSRFEMLDITDAGGRNQTGLKEGEGTGQDDDRVDDIEDVEQERNQSWDREFAEGDSSLPNAEDDDDRQLHSATCDRSDQGLEPHRAD